MKHKLSKNDQSLNDHGIKSAPRKKPKVVLLQLHKWRKSGRLQVESSLDKLFKTKTLKPKYNPLTSEGGW
jgi:hypothetical protein